MSQDWVDDLFRIRGLATVPIADSATPTVVSAEDAKSFCISATGTTTAPRAMILPHKKGALWLVDVQTAYALTVKGPTGTGPDVPPGANALVYSDGTNFKGAGLAQLGLVTTTKTIATADIQLSPAESVADRIVLLGVPAASHTVTMDPVALRPDGTMLRVLNGASKVHTLIDGNGDTFAIYPGEFVVFEWADSGTPTISVVARSTIGGASIPVTPPAAGQVLVAASPTASVWRGPNPTTKITGAGGTTNVTDQDQTVFVNTAASGQTLMLPSIAAVPTSDGRRIIAKAGASGSTHSVVINGNGANIDAAGTYTIPTDWGGVELVFVYGQGWIIAAKF
jgi:hypothetical protein